MPASAAAPAIDAAAPWPQAERLFRSDPDWRGGDAAYSVPLGGDRVLWLFGDSFVTRRAPGSAPQPRRAGCAMVRNSVGLQTGADPTAARMQFAWRGRGTAAAPGDWFAPEGAAWLWPLHGVYLDGACLDGAGPGGVAVVFCTRVESTGGDGPFSFRAAGWRAFVLRGVDGPLDDWRQEPAQLPAPAPFDVVVGTAVLADGDHVYAFVLREPGDHAVFVLRWPHAAFARGDLRAPEWRDGDRWVAHAALRAAPAPVLAEGAPEFSVVRQGSAFWMVQSLGFGSSDVAVRTAPRPWGPWSAPRVVFHPPEGDDPGLFTYAAKALRLDDGALLATYASNGQDFGRLCGDERLYYPHCLRLCPR
ncbi:MAG: DUF4185 domain-containing protein [Planctomycetota bacterium]